MKKPTPDLIPVLCTSDYGGYPICLDHSLILPIHSTALAGQLVKAQGSAKVPKERSWKKASMSCVTETNSDTIYIDVDVDPKDIGYIEIYLR